MVSINIPYTGDAKLAEILIIYPTGVEVGWTWKAKLCTHFLGTEHLKDTVFDFDILCADYGSDAYAGITCLAGRFRHWPRVRHSCDLAQAPQPC